MKQQSEQAAFEKGRPSSDEAKATPEAASSHQPKKDPLRPKAHKGRGTPLRFDVTGAYHYREDDQATGAIFGSSPYASLAVRGARLWGDEVYRFGLWLGYRFEPGSTRTIFVGSGSKGAESWMMSHDATLGALFDLRAFRDTSFALFVRLSGGFGLSVTTLQLHSLDDGHLYSETTRSPHATAFVDTGVVLFRRLELLAGVGGLAGWDASLELKHSDDELPAAAERVGPVHLSGLLLHAGVGLEF